MSPAEHGSGLRAPRAVDDPSSRPARRTSVRERLSDKALYLFAARAANQEFVQPNYGRVHQATRRLHQESRRDRSAIEPVGITDRPEDLAYWSGYLRSPETSRFPISGWWSDWSQISTDCSLRTPAPSFERTETFRPEPEPSRQPAETERPEPAELERFDGLVDRVDGDTAFITLSSPRGERFSGPYPAHELAAKGIHEGDRFSLATIDEGDAVRFDIRPVPRRTLSPEELAAIRAEIDRELDGYTPHDAY